MMVKTNFMMVKTNFMTSKTSFMMTNPSFMMSNPSFIMSKISFKSVEPTLADLFLKKVINRLISEFRNEKEYLTWPGLEPLTPRSNC